ncbi:MAG: STAS/SEC14 domain-containing protein [Salinivirgaceae bacterium]|jgi:hypothetical protein|nr:STAS/SEC14 domain-containing protein [Salinivirgaceae bacterium]
MIRIVDFFNLILDFGDEWVVDSVETDHKGKEKQLGMIKWKGKSTSEEYQSTFLSLLDLQKKETITRYISDIRDQGVISPSDRKWFETVALPLAISQGLKAAAVILDGNVFKKYYVNVVLASTNKFGLPFKMFSTLEEAIVWLMARG